jgi:hypothetical protein
MGPEVTFVQFSRASRCGDGLGVGSMAFRCGCKGEKIFTAAVERSVNGEPDATRRISNLMGSHVVVIDACHATFSTGGMRQYQL